MGVVLIVKRHRSTLLIRTEKKVRLKTIKQALTGRQPRNFLFIYLYVFLVYLVDMNPSVILIHVVSLFIAGIGGSMDRKMIVAAIATITSRLADYREVLFYLSLYSYNEDIVIAKFGGV